MDYLSALDLTKEPFSTSPDPEFFYGSLNHQDCLLKVELALRLRRGLNAVVGDVGSGKTTLCRQLVRRLAKEGQCETHMILAPEFKNVLRFLQIVADMLKAGPYEPEDEWSIKEAIKKALLWKGVDQGRNVVLLIDEAQKLPGFCLEALREFLNYETNRFKLLQIVLFGQLELEDMLVERRSLADRVNLYYVLEPLKFRDTRELIRFRLRVAGGKDQVPRLFTFAAFWLIYRTSQGFPRKIVNICHKCLVALIIGRRKRVTWFLARSCIHGGGVMLSSAWRRAALATIILLPGLALAVAVALDFGRSPAKGIAQVRSLVASVKQPAAESRVHRGKIVRSSVPQIQQAAVRQPIIR